MISLRSLDRASDGAASGGGACGNYMSCASIKSSNKCPSGFKRTGGTSHCHSSTGGGSCSCYGTGERGEHSGGSGAWPYAGGSGGYGSGAGTPMKDGCAPWCKNCPSGGGGGSGG